MNNRIEFGAFQLTDTTRKNVNACLESGWLTMGPVVKTFEEKWRNLFGYKYARALSSGTAADTACCMALYEMNNGAIQGDEIICPALSFIATANSIRAAGFKPVFVDIEKETLNIDTSKIEDAITPRTRAIMTVNLMGRTAELDVIQDICSRYGLVHIIDNCEGYGAQFKGKLSLWYGDMETSSHFLAHIAFCVEGGMVSMRDAPLDRLIEGIRSHGRMGGGHYFNHEVFGLNFKPTDLNFSIGLEEIDDFTNTFKQRRHNLHQMQLVAENFRDIVYLVEEDEDRINAPHAFSITMKKPGRIKELTRRLDEANIAWKRNFGCMATQHGCFDYLGHKLGEFPNAEWVGDNGIHIGVHKLLSENDIDRIRSVLYKFLSDERSVR